MSLVLMITVIRFVSFSVAYVSEVCLLGRTVSASIGIYTCIHIWRYMVLLEWLSIWAV